jgi:hypothetical protein
MPLCALMTGLELACMAGEPNEKPAVYRKAESRSLCRLNGKDSMQRAINAILIPLMACMPLPVSQGLLRRMRSDADVLIAGEFRLATSQ